MKEYQTVIARLTRHVREDEDALTDLLNERSRAGWSPGMMSQDGDRLVVIFERDTPSGDTPSSDGAESGTTASVASASPTSTSTTPRGVNAIVPPAAE